MHIRVSTKWSKWYKRYFPYILWKENVLFWFYKKSLVFVSKGWIGNRSALDCVVAWNQTGTKPLPELWSWIMTMFTDTQLHNFLLSVLLRQAIQIKIWEIFLSPFLAYVIPSIVRRTDMMVGLMNWIVRDWSGTLVTNVPFINFSVYLRMSSGDIYQLWIWYSTVNKCFDTSLENMETNGTEKT